jgi:hypothetical protein
VPTTVHLWHRRGLLKAHRFNTRRDWLFEPPAPGLPAKWKHKRKGVTRRLPPPAGKLFATDPAEITPPTSKAM